MNSITQAISAINQTLQGSANARLVYGEPVTLEHKIVLPVAKIVFGYGEGGAGIGPAGKQSEQAGEAGGGGGGMIAYPAGVFEVTEKKTRFIAASNKATWGFSLVVAFMLGSMMSARKAKR